MAEDVLFDCGHHLIAYGRDIVRHLPPGLSYSPELVRRGLVVRELKMLPIECIVRGYLTGSGWKSYQKTGCLNKCSTELAAGLNDGSRLNPPAFNPTTKEECGHDLAINDRDVVLRYGDWIRDKSLGIYYRVAMVAKRHGLLLADTKFEFGDDGSLGDEVATPDSSRFWDKDDWEKAAREKRSPTPYDKQVVRNWGKGFDLNERDPQDQADLDFVRQLQVPQGVIDETCERYHVVFQRLTGQTLDEFQENTFGVWC